MPFRPRTIIILFLLLLGLAACAAGEKNHGPDPGEAATVSQTFYAGPEVVLEATRKALRDFDFVVTQTKQDGPALWRLTVKKGPTNVVPEDVTGLVVQGQGAKQTQVHLMVDNPFWRPWSTKPAWADNLFGNIFDHLP